MSARKLSLALILTLVALVFAWAVFPGESRPGSDPAVLAPPNAPVRDLLATPEPEDPPVAPHDSIEESAQPAPEQMPEPAQMETIDLSRYDGWSWRTIATEYRRLKDYQWDLIISIHDSKMEVLDGICGPVDWSGSVEIPDETDGIEKPHLRTRTTKAPPGRSDGRVWYYHT